LKIGDIAHYTVITGHGSSLTVKFRLTKVDNYKNDYGESTFLHGDLVVTGFAKSIQEQVGLAALGFMPEAGGHIAVKKIGKDADGLSKFATELITEVLPTE